MRDKRRGMRGMKGGHTECAKCSTGDFSLGFRKKKLIFQWTLAVNFCIKLIIMISCFVFREISFEFRENLRKFFNFVFREIRYRENVT